MPLSKSFPQAVRSWWWFIRGWDSRTWAVCLFEKPLKLCQSCNPKMTEKEEWWRRYSAFLLKARVALFGVLAQIKILFYLCDYVFKWRILQTWEQRVPLRFLHKCLQSKNVTRHDLSQLQWQLRFPSWPSAAPQDFDRRIIPGGSFASE